ncbi:MAG: pyrroline-5-carboxylate reductase [Woeseiaceae bacterium]
MTSKNVGFVGGGNMTLAIARGLLGSGFPASNVAISEPSTEQRNRLTELLPGVTTGSDNAAIAERVDCVVLATKPQVLASVCGDLAASVQERKPLIISIAAGVRSSNIQSWLGGGLAVIRAMPNQPAFLGLGVSALFANDKCDDADRELATTIMAAVGKVVQVSTEADIDSVTAISGSGPAYFYLLIDMLVQTAIAMGLDDATARTLAVETAVGAAALAADSNEAMSELIAKVRSPGGTTAAALNSLEQQDIRVIFGAALTAAKQRATELADETGK